MADRRATEVAVHIVIQRLQEDVSDESPAKQPETLVEALAVKRNVTVGLGVGVGVAAVAYAVRVFELYGPVVTTREYPVLGPEGWFLMLAVVFAVSTALLVMLVLTAVQAAALTRDV
jgi:hypothetical protein